MSDMIERMATAIDLSHWVVSKPPASRDKAIAALKVMREPTEEMIRAGYKAYGAADLVASDDWLKTLYGAMIDAALAEPKA